ncbi:hypothetical protein OAE44_00760, partial [bacterium]|nr:hypothetical protein [bacterium]
RSRGGTVRIKGNLSSQYLSGLMMAAPLAAQDTVIEIDGSLISRPYVEMTKRVMESFGVGIEVDQQFGRFEIGGGQTYQASDYQIEPDASSASYFWAVAAICGGSATVLGLDERSLQGDVGFVNCLEQMGCGVEWGQGQVTVRGPAKRGIDIDMSNVSDTVQTLTAVALFVEGPTNVRNIAHNRVKETDRIGNLAIELRKLGATVEEREDWYDRYMGMSALLPFAKAVSAKSHDFDADGNETSTDYLKVMQMVMDSGYHGWVGIEYEGGKLSEADGIKATKKLLESCRQQLSNA